MTSRERWMRLPTQEEALPAAEPFRGFRVSSGWAAAILAATAMVGGFGIKLGQLQAKLDSAVADITYIKGRIDGAPPKQALPLTSLLMDPIDSLFPIHVHPDTQARTVAVYTSRTK